MRARNVGLTAGGACSVGMGAVTSVTPWPAARGTPPRHGGRRTRPSAPRAPRRRGRRRRGRDRDCSRPPRRGDGAGSGYGRPRNPPVARSRTRRAWGSVEPSSAKRRDTGPTRWRGTRARASKVARSRTRQIRPRAASGHGLGGPEARLSRRASASGYGNRGSSHACGYWVGRFVSRRLASSKVTARTRSRDPRREAEQPSVPVCAPGCATRPRETAPCRNPQPVLRFLASRGYGRHSRTSPVSLGLDPAER